MKAEYPGSKVINKIKTTWHGINQRCNNPKRLGYKHYGGKGIKNKITINELYFLWIRDQAHLMKRPSIDRIDSNGDYCIANCQFLELKENTLKCRRERELRIYKRTNGIRLVYFKAKWHRLKRKKPYLLKFKEVASK